MTITTLAEMNTKRVTDVPIPIWMAKLPKDKRGYPIPVNVLMDDESRPHFPVTDERKRQDLILKDKCAICGGGLLKRKALVGGPRNAFQEKGAYIDSPMHIECAHYALQVCPYLAAPHYNKLIDFKKVDPSKFEGGIVVGTDDRVEPKRPDLFVMVICTKIAHIKDGPRFVQYLKPVQPYHAVEYWQHGQQLSDAEGYAMTAELLEEVEP